MINTLSLKKYAICWCIFVASICFCFISLFLFFLSSEESDEEPRSSGVPGMGVDPNSWMGKMMENPSIKMDDIWGVPLILGNLNLRISRLISRLSPLRWTHAYIVGLHLLIGKQTRHTGRCFRNVDAFKCVFPGLLDGWETLSSSLAPQGDREYIGNMDTPNAP